MGPFYVLQWRWPMAPALLLCPAAMTRGLTPSSGQVRAWDGKYPGSSPFGETRGREEEEAWLRPPVPSTLGPQAGTRGCQVGA